MVIWTKKSLSSAEYNLVSSALFASFFLTGHPLAKCYVKPNCHQFDFETKLIGCKFGQNMEGIWTLHSNNMVAHWPVSASLATLTQGKCYVKPMTTIWLWRKKPIGCEFCQFMKHISDMKPTFINRLWVCEYCSMTNIKLTEL